VASILIIENGEGVVGANSYISAADARSYVANRGLTLPAAGTGVDPVEVLLILAMDYLESLRAEYQGTKTAQTNPLQWPRVDVSIDSFSIASDEIPNELKLAQAQLACDSYSTGNLMPTGDGREVLSERVEGAVTVTYAQLGITNLQPIFTKARAMLSPLLSTGCYGGYPLVAFRV